MTTPPQQPVAALPDPGDAAGAPGNTGEVMLVDAGEATLTFLGGRGIVVATAMSADLHRRVPLVFNAADFLARLPELTALARLAAERDPMPAEPSAPPA